MSAAVQGQQVQTAGFPSDKPGTMWMQNCTDFDPVDYDYGYFYISCWVFYGQSGAGPLPQTLCEKCPTPKRPVQATTEMLLVMH